MYYLVYMSVPSGRLDDSDYIHILDKAHANNQANNISGMLLATEAYFMQYIEGGEEEVKHLYNKITLDKRHQSLFILEQGEIDRRFFDGWKMGFDYMGWVARRKDGLSPVLKSPEWAWSEDDLKHRPIELMNRFREQFSQLPAGNI